MEPVSDEDEVAERAVGDLDDEQTVEVLTGLVERSLLEAEASIALIDGLLLLRQLAGPDAADRAARALGIA